MASRVSPLSLPFKEAIAFFLEKLLIPTEKWNEILDRQHNLAFVVAGAVEADLLSDLYKATLKAISDGTTIAEFRADFDNIVADNGWSYTGGRDWRTRVIFDTNVRQAYNGGRETQMADPELLKRRPIRVYKHGDSIVPRQSHLAMHNKAWFATNPIWNHISPSNGYLCSCFSLLMTVEEARARGITVYDGSDGLDGFVPDRGFNYRPGPDSLEYVYEDIRSRSKGYPPGLASKFNKFMDESRK